MNTYIVAFEITGVDRLNKFRESLKTYGSYCPINATCWAIKSEKKALDIVNHLKANMGPADKVFVLRSGTAASWLHSYGKGHDDWLKEHL